MKRKILGLLILILGLFGLTSCESESNEIDSTQYFEPTLEKILSNKELIESYTFYTKDKQFHIFYDGYPCDLKDYADRSTSDYSIDDKMEYTTIIYSQFKYKYVINTNGFQKEYYRNILIIISTNFDDYNKIEVEDMVSGIEYTDESVLMEFKMVKLNDDNYDDIITFISDGKDVFGNLIISDHKVISLD